jgi:hypothetical protein
MRCLRTTYLPNVYLRLAACAHARTRSHALHRPFQCSDNLAYRRYRRLPRNPCTARGTAQKQRARIKPYRTRIATRLSAQRATRVPPASAAMATTRRALAVILCSQIADVVAQTVTSINYTAAALALGGLPSAGDGWPNVAAAASIAATGVSLPSTGTIQFVMSSAAFASVQLTGNCTAVNSTSMVRREWPRAVGGAATGAGMRHKAAQRRATPLRPSHAPFFSFSRRPSARRAPPADVLRARRLGHQLHARLLRGLSRRAHGYGGPCNHGPSRVSRCWRRRARRRRRRRCRCAWRAT